MSSGLRHAWTSASVRSLALWGCAIFQSELCGRNVVCLFGPKRKAIPKRRTEQTLELTTARCASYCIGDEQPIHLATRALVHNGLNNDETFFPAYVRETGAALNREWVTSCLSSNSCLRANDRSLAAEDRGFVGCQEHIVNAVHCFFGPGSIPRFESKARIRFSAIQSLCTVAAGAKPHHPMKCYPLLWMRQKEKTHGQMRAMRQ
jgi:hypothetical protein